MGTVKTSRQVAADAVPHGFSPPVIPGGGDAVPFRCNHHALIRQIGRQCDGVDPDSGSAQVGDLRVVANRRVRKNISHGFREGRTGSQPEKKNSGE